MFKKYLLIYYYIAHGHKPRAKSIDKNMSHLLLDISNLQADCCVPFPNLVKRCDMQNIKNGQPKSVRDNII